MSKPTLAQIYYLAEMYDISRDNRDVRFGFAYDVVVSEAPTIEQLGSLCHAEKGSTAQLEEESILTALLILGAKHGYDKIANMAVGIAGIATNNQIAS